MTDKEVAIFIGELYATFPDYCESVKRSSPDPAMTHRSWARSWSNLTLDECRAVLDSWVNGIRKRASGFEWANVAIDIRQCVLFDRQQYSRRRSLSEAEQRHAKPLKYERHSNFAAIWHLAEEANRKLRDGEITEEQWEAMKESLAKQVT